MTEDKHVIIAALSDCIKQTRYGEDVDRLDYIDGDDMVEVVYKNGKRLPVSVWGDSGIGIIADVVAAIKRTF